LASLGHCRSCKDPIARWVLAIEVTTGAVLATIARQVGWENSLAPALALATGLIAISAVDIVYTRIPTRFVYLTALAVLVTGIPRLVDAPDSAIGAAVGGALCLVSLGTMHLASPQMLGFGDVRLATLIGATVGWLGWTADEPVFRPLGHVVSAMILAGLLGSLVGVVLLVVRRRNVAYPFGPCLAAGAVAVLLL
jgi:leader peptidase (prepilin peptidase)/N-methyltransferase